MATVINRTSLEVKHSVSAGYFPAAQWIHNPDLSSVQAVDPKYWKIVGDNVVEMTQAEKDAVDAIPPEPANVNMPHAAIPIDKTITSGASRHVDASAGGVTIDFAATYSIVWEGMVEGARSSTCFEVAILVNGESVAARRSKSRARAPKSMTVTATQVLLPGDVVQGAFCRSQGRGLV